jgi:hypothetical protein
MVRLLTVILLSAPLALLVVRLQCSAVQCSAVQCSEVQCSAVQCSAVQCSAVQGSAVQHAAQAGEDCLDQDFCSCPPFLRAPGPGMHFTKVTVQAFII